VPSLEISPSDSSSPVSGQIPGQISRIAAQSRPTFLAFTRYPVLDAGRSPSRFTAPNPRPSLPTELAHPCQPSLLLPATRPRLDPIASPPKTLSTPFAFPPLTPSLQLLVRAGPDPVRIPMVCGRGRGRRGPVGPMLMRNRGGTARNGIPGVIPGPALSKNSYFAWKAARSIGSLRERSQCGASGR
jgi:hypothetical protein